MDAREAASRLCVSRRTVQLWAARLGVQRINGGFWLDEQDIERIRERLGNLGRPRKWKPREAIDEKNIKTVDNGRDSR